MSHVMRPMLAENSRLTYQQKLDHIQMMLKEEHLLGAVKLDGIRGLVEDVGLLSRSLKLIPNKYTRERFHCADLYGVDGELILEADATHPDIYRRTNSAVMTIKGEPNVELFVFDHRGSPTLPFYRRLEHLEQVEHAFITHVQHVVCKTVEDVVALDDRAIEMGFEGLILRHPFGPYKANRATLREGWALKLKRFEDSEAEVIGFIEQMHNGNEAETNELGLTKRSKKSENLIPAGTLGALVCRDIKEGWEFEIGTGFTMAEAQEIWEHREQWYGQIITYRFMRHGMKDKPRHPSYKGKRSTDDL